MREIPEWVTVTPDQIEEYSLDLWIGGNSEQNVELTRDEFLALKDHLAALRGYNVPRSAEQAVKMVSALRIEGYNLRDEQQPARHLQTARDFYQAIPKLVVFDSGEFDAGLEQIAR